MEKYLDAMARVADRSILWRLALSMVGACVLLISVVVFAVAITATYGGILVVMSAAVIYAVYKEANK